MKSRRLNLALAIAVVISLLIFLILGIQALLLAFSVVLTYFIAKDMLSDRIFSSKFYKFITSLILYVAVLQAVTVAAWLFDHNYPLNWSVFITAIILIIGYIWRRITYERQGRLVDNIELRMFAPGDLIGLAIAAITLILIVGAPIVQSIKHYGDINIPALTVDFLNTNVDDASHLSRINDHLQLNRGVIYESNEQKYVVLQDSIITYPPGWFSANALVIKSLDSHIKVGGQSMLAYVLTKLFWTIILAYCFARVVWDLFLLFMRPKNRKKVFLTGMWLVGATGFLSYLIIIEQFKEGFYSFIPVLISLLIAIPLFAQLNLDNKLRQVNRLRTLLPIILILVYLTLSWFLILPAVAIAILIAFMYPGIKIRLKKNLLELWREIISIAPILLLSAVAILAQIKLITSSKSQTFEVRVNTPGAIAVQSVAYFVFIFIGLGLLYLLVNQIHKKMLASLTILLSSLLGFSLFIYIFQLLTVNGPEYYFYKTFDTVMIVAMPLAIVGWALLIDFLCRGFETVSIVMVSLAMIISLPLVIGIQAPNDPGLLKYTLSKRTLTLSEDAFIYNNVSSRSKTPLPDRTASVIFDIPGDTGDSIVATNLLRSTEHLTLCDNTIFSNLLVDNQPGIFSAIKNCHPANITVVTKSAYYTAIKNLASSYGDQKSQILSVN